MGLKVDDIAPHGYTIDRATVRQRKTGRPVKFELTEQTRQAIDDYLRDASKKPGEFLFMSSRRIGLSWPRRVTSTSVGAPYSPSCIKSMLSGS